MATPQELQDQLDKFNKELDKINQRIVDSGELLGGSESSLVKGLISAVTQARKLSDPLKDAASITTKLNKLADDNESLIIRRKVAEENYAKALNKGIQKQIDLKLINLQRISAELKIQQNLEDQLRTLQGIAEQEEKNKKEKAKQNDLVEIAKNKYKSIAQMFSAAGIFAFFTKAILDANQQTTELGKSFGISVSATENIRQNVVEFSRATNDAFLNTDRLLKAQTELSQQLEISVKFSNQELATFSKLTEIVGLTADEAGRLTKASAGAGMELQDYVKNIRNSSFYAQQATKTHFTDKQILQDVSKLSAGILTKFQGNPKAIAEAVVQAKALGTSLEQIDKIGESLLNWESSISNELEAELITGRQINLEKARYAALTGTQLDLEKEISSQVGSLAEFQDMNVIAQGSLAKAFGLSRDELADMLLKQEAISKYGDQASKLNKDQLADMERRNMSASEYLDMVTNQRSIQEKFNDAMLKLQDIIGNLVAGPLGTFVSFLVKGLDYITAIATVFGTIFTIQKGIAAYQEIIAIAKGKELAVQIGIAAAWAIANPFQALAGLAIAGGVAALVASQMSAAPEFANGGIVTSEINNATVGEAGPEAIIPLNSPKAASMLGGGGNMDMVVNAIDRLNSRIDNAMNRPAVAYIQGENAFAKNLGSIKALGSSQVQNSYNLA